MQKVRRKGPLSREDAERLAIDLLGFIAGDPERLGPFLAATGLGPETLRAAAGSSTFLASVLDYAARDEALLADFARERPLDPGQLEAAQRLLEGSGS